MGAETDLTAADRRWLSPLPLWTGILAGPVAWAFDLEASYAILHWTCSTQRTQVLYGITLLCLLVTAGGLALSWIALRHADAPRTEPRTDADAERDRARFMAMLGLGLGVLFALAIVANAIPRSVLDACS